MSWSCSTSLLPASRAGSSETILPRFRSSRRQCQTFHCQIIALDRRMAGRTRANPTNHHPNAPSRRGIFRTRHHCIGFSLTDTLQFSVHLRPSCAPTHPEHAPWNERVPDSRNALLPTADEKRRAISHSFEVQWFVSLVALHSFMQWKPSFPRLHDARLEDQGFSYFGFRGFNHEKAAFYDNSAFNLQAVTQHNAVHARALLRLPLLPGSPSTLAHFTQRIIRHQKIIPFIGFAFVIELLP